ncbi:MAG: phospholipase D-like domain-containing protein [Cyanobacteria bacterium P01_E01_bin.34]
MSVRWGRLILTGLGLLVLIAIGYWVAPSVEQNWDSNRLLEPLPQHPYIHVAFNQERSHRYTDPYRHIERYGEDLEALLIQEIEQARYSIAVAVQEINLPDIAHALAGRQRAGLRVRVIVENSYRRNWGELTPSEIDRLDDDDRRKFAEYLQLVDSDRNGRISLAERQHQDALTILEAAEIPIVDDTEDGSRGSDLMHHKFMVVDDREVVTGSANWTLSGMHGDLNRRQSRGNANHLVTLSSDEIAQIFLEEFGLMWGDGPGGVLDSRFGVNKPERQVQQVQVGDATVGVHFSPAGAEVSYALTSGGEIDRALARASSSVDLALFVFSDRTIAERLQLLRDRGLNIRGVFDPGFAYRDFSQTLTLWNLADDVCLSDNEPQRLPLETIGVPELPDGDKLHHKFAIIDALGTSPTVVTGSYNWSNAANRKNDETVLTISSPTVAAHFSREFDRLYRTATLGPPNFLLADAPKLEQCAPDEGIVVVNLNSASLDELDTLPGIGPKLAERIVDARPIRSLHDLEEIDGIGSGKVDDLRGLVVW